MSHSRTGWWVIYAGCAAALLGALGWISYAVLDLESAEARARIEMAHAEAAREAVARMDALVAAQVAVEAARSEAEYGTLDSLSPGPLVNYRGRYVRMHLVLDSDGKAKSPQAPSERFIQFEVDGAQAGDFWGSNRSDLADLSPRLDYGALRAHVLRTEAEILAVAEEQLPQRPMLSQGGQAEGPVAQQIDDLNQQQSRANTKQAVAMQQAFTNVAPAVRGPWGRSGLFVPRWLADDAELIFLRRVVTPGRYSKASGITHPDEESLQGFVVDWPQLRSDLVEQVADLFPDAELQPASANSADGAYLLASAPIELRVPPPEATPAGWTTTHTAIAFTWLVTLLALGGGAWTLRASNAYAERRNRFASAVTHELRTPLTTFRMYSEMLAEGMVTDPEKRAEYLGTLRDESDRLSTLVENVLAFSRLERGRAATRRERVTLGELIERARRPIDERARRSALEVKLDLRGPAGEPLEIDVDAVGRILLNLADNACKYGASTEHPRVDLAAWVEARMLHVEVRDHGPGVPRGERRAIFEAFRRAAGREDGSVPGIGLGLALSRELARSMGGDLTLVDDGRAGACFRLVVPAT